MKPNRTSARALAPVGAAIVALAVTGCGGQSATTKHDRSAGPNLGGAAAAGARAGSVVEAPDPEAAKSYPEPANAPPHALARAPQLTRAALATTVAPGAPSDAEIRAELHQLQQIQRAGPGRPGSIGADGTVVAPPATPALIARIIGGGNAIASFPYRFGGGHASFIDDAYDCSGSVSYALAAAGLLGAPLTSGELESWGAAGPGRWLTVYANAGHTYMYVGGLRFDTSGRDGPFGSRWQVGVRTNEGFVARHWPGL